MSRVPELFGSMVFSESVMRDRLPKNVYRALCATIREGRALDPAVADVVAAAMKDWAVSKGATHFTHWFQPMTGITAEKHDAFLSPAGDGTVQMEFSGKELVKGEPDASSFPSGGLRATFEARGYTAWDPTSYAFIKDNTLCIPTAFCSYTGEILDKKTPLLRSMDALSRQAVRVLQLFGKQAKRVSTTVGPEQEYFLIPEELYAKRPDLVLTGRTLLGARTPKGQELEDHYFGSIRPKVKAFLEELDEELWKLGICAKTEHNEVAPAQHEMAPLFTTANLAIDANQLAMEVLKKVAHRHGFACLLHEKPFEGVNGSGKHNNWALCTDEGENLLEPGKTPRENAQFLLFLTAVLRAVDENQDLLRISVASPGNDHRLGANEAPPAIVSVYIGDELQAVVEELMSGRHTESGPRGQMDMGVLALPPIPVDTSDRNRTSPFAFTGNKFEFRMCGSQQNLADPNVVLNTAVAEQCDRFATKLEGVPEEEFTTVALRWVRHTLRDHHRVIFEGNGYSEEWEAEAARRGLPNLKSTPDALPCMIRPENIAFYEKYHVLDSAEIHARYVSKAEQYAKLLNIEANTMVYMARSLYLPALSDYSGDLASSVATKAEIGIESPVEKGLVSTITEGITAVSASADELERVNAEAQRIEDPQEQCNAYRDTVLPAMSVLRTAVDGMEKVCGADYWPVPTYNEMLFWV